ncbi:MAG: DUF1460 domain-containing protein [Bacteroidales bacterium]|nr:DUF1460 domain-containing protein [Bacteroidales bacterium]
MKIGHAIIYISALVGSVGNAQSIRWHNESADTLKINELLAISAAINDPQERVAAVAQHFIDIPYVAGTLESNSKNENFSGKSSGKSEKIFQNNEIASGDNEIASGNNEIASGKYGEPAKNIDGLNGGDEVLTVNIDEVDCTTLIDYVAALALTGGEHRTSWRDFVYNLQRMRYRNGEVKGYPSRLHYISDWIVDNAHRGNLEEVTNRCDLATYEVKSLNFMSANRNLYPALADSANFARIKEAESGYRNHRYPIIKTQRVGNAAKNFLRTGDIVALCTTKKGLDVSHMGILFIDEKKVPYLLHASSKAGKVILDATPLEQYLTKNRLAGIRVIRLKE